MMDWRQIRGNINRAYDQEGRTDMKYLKQNKCKESSAA